MIVDPPRWPRSALPQARLSMTSAIDGLLAVDLVKTPAGPRTSSGNTSAARTYYEPRSCPAMPPRSVASAPPSVKPVLKNCSKPPSTRRSPPKRFAPNEFERIIVDSTVQEKAIAHPVDSRLLEIARAKVVQAAKFAGIGLKQTFAKEGRKTAAQGRRLRPCQTVQAAAARRQTATHDPGHRPA
jgi:hypothetical protein